MAAFTQLLIPWFAATVLLVGSLGKLADVEGFATALSGLRVPGKRWLKLLVPGTEAVLAVALVVPAWRAASLLGAAALFAGFGAVVAAQTFSQQPPASCGCLGSHVQLTPGVHLAVGDALVAAALLATWAAGQSALSASGADAALIAAHGVLAGLVFWLLIYVSSVLPRLNSSRRTA